MNQAQELDWLESWDTSRLAGITLSWPLLASLGSEEVVKRSLEAHALIMIQKVRKSYPWSEKQSKDRTCLRLRSASQRSADLVRQDKPG